MYVHVTGAEGFLGKHLVAELERQGHEVTGSGRQHALAPYGAMRYSAPDAVVHLGAVGKHCSPESIYLYNVASVLEWARYCQACGSRFILASTHEVVLTVPSKGNLARVRSPHEFTSTYALSKWQAEEVVRWVSMDSGWTIARLGMVYGPGNLRNALARFFQAAFRGEDIRATEGAARHWLYVDDAVRALALLVEREHDRGMFYVTRDDHESKRLMVDVAQDVVELTGSASQVWQVAPAADEVLTSVIAPVRLRELGWVPKVGYRQGLIETHEWLNTNA